MQSQLQCHWLSSVPKKPPLSIWSSTTTTSCIVYAGNKDLSSSSSSSSSQSPQEEYGFNFDKDKARQALKALDQQLDTMYEKQASSPKFRVVEDEDPAGTEEMTEQEMPDFSGSFAPYFSLFLIAFTIFYNVLFYTVIKPAVDGPSEPVMASASAPAGISSQTLGEPVLRSSLPEAPQ